MKITKRIILIPAALLLLSGCGMSSLQKQQVAQFGAATKGIGTFAEKELPELRHQMIEMRTTALILSEDDNKKIVEKAKEVWDKPASADDTAKRLAAAKALKSYGSLLNELAAADRKDSISKKAQELVTAFDAAPLKEKLSDKQKGAVAGIITSLGNMWVEKEKKDAVKVIVSSYTKPVDELADLLAADFDAEGAGYLGGYTAIADHLDYIAGNTLESGKPLTLADKELAVKAIATGEFAKKKAKSVEMVVQKAISDLKDANKRLVEVLQQDDYTAKEIKAYAKSIQELVNMAEALTDK